MKQKTGQKIKQKKGQTSVSFEFLDDEVVFTEYCDAGSVAVRVDYEEFPFDTSNAEARVPAYLKMGCMFGIMGILMGIDLYTQLGKLTSGYWMVLTAIGGIFLTLYYKAPVRNSVFHTSSGAVYVLRDKNYTKIMREIASRRNVKLRHRYGVVNWNNNLEAEAKKFEWLKSNGVITEAEYSEALSQIGPIASPR